MCSLELSSLLKNCNTSRVKLKSAIFLPVWLKPALNTLPILFCRGRVALASDLLRHFRLLLWNRWTEFNETWQEARSQHPLPRLCFSGRSKKQDGLPGLWLAETFSTSHLYGIQQNLIGYKICKRHLPSLCFSDRSEKHSGLRDVALGPLSTKLDRKVDLNVLYQFVFFGPIGKSRWLQWPLISWDIFDFSFETVEWNSTKLDR